MPDSRPPAPSLTGNIMIAAIILALIWAVFFADMIHPADLKLYGIRPRNTDGLSGIFFAPFLHSGYPHITNNSWPLFVLLVISLSLSRFLTASALPLIVLIGGAGVWLFGKPHSVHIGASGVIFGLIGFLLFIGIFARRWKPLIFSVVVFFAYGGSVWALFRYEQGISWSSHAWGFAAGVIAARLLRNSGRTPSAEVSADDA